MKNFTRILTLCVTVSLGGVAQAQSAAGQFRGDVIRTFEDTGKVIAGLGRLDGPLSDLRDGLSQTDISSEEIARATDTLANGIEALQHSKLSISLFELERSKHLTVLGVEDVNICNAHSDYGLILRTAKNAIGRTLADFHGQQDDLTEAIAATAEQRRALIEMRAMIERMGDDESTAGLDAVLVSVDLEFFNAQKSLVSVTSRVAQQRPELEVAYAQLEKSLTAFRSEQAACIDEIARQKTSKSVV